VHTIPSWVKSVDTTLKLARALQNGEPVRVGETSVASASVHTFDPTAPDCVGVVRQADAGRLFYHRKDRNRVLHLDVFHEVGEVSHYTVARMLQKALESCEMHGFMDYIDIQTATGGGRVSGSLRFGQKASLRRAHMNHVHIAAALDENTPKTIPWLVYGAEKAIAASGLEIRKVQAITLFEAENGAQTDLSAYGSFTDSWLKGDQIERAQREQELFKKACALAEEYGDVGDVQQMFLQIDDYSDTSPKRKKTTLPWRRKVEALEEQGYAERKGNDVRLTALGHEMYGFLSSKKSEIEFRLRRLLCQFNRVGRLTRLRRNKPLPQNTRAFRLGVTAIPLQRSEWATDLALPETVLAASVKMEPKIRIRHTDLRKYRVRTLSSAPVCLLIDASSSMAGERIRAARYLAQHLLLISKDKLAVVVFSEDSVAVEVPFTRDVRSLRAGLNRINPFGLTPLAEGIIGAKTYIQESRTKNSLLLLITDGIPTVPKWSLNPIGDALKAAEELRSARIRFGCIGLAPNRKFLQDLSECANGSLHIVDELERHTLAGIARKERGL
jgi:magnesium chelatase subunit D